MIGLRVIFHKGDLFKIMKKVLITGVTGFAGSFLAEHLSNNTDDELVGTCLTDNNLSNISAVKDKIKLVKVDLTDSQAVDRLISDTMPEHIYHLAALPSPADSFKDPQKYMTNNINAQVCILEAVKKSNLTNSRVLVVASAEVYGLVKPEDIPIDEDTPLRPVSPYGVSKIAQDFLGLQYFLAHGIKVVRVRPFGHVGPRLSDQFAASAFAKKIAEIEKGKREPILNVGNLNAKRDLTDVRDIVQGYQMLLEKGVPGDVYNLGSGVSHPIKEILDTLLSFSTIKIRVEVDRTLFRPNDIPELRCDNSKMRSLTGWEAKVPLKTSLKDTLDYWREMM